VLSTEPLWTAREVAAYLACAEETVKRLVRRKQLAATRVGNRLRFARADVEAYRLGHRGTQGEPQFAANEAPAATDEGAAPGAASASAAAYLTRLQLVTGVLSQLHTPAQAAELLVKQCVLALDAASGLLSMVREQVIELVHSHGYQPQALDAWRSMPLAAELPLATAVRHGEPMFFENAAALVARFPTLAGASVVNAAWAIIPLPVDNQVIGGIVLSFAAPRTFSRDDRAFLVTLAQQCAQAMERARLYAAEHAMRLAAEQAAQRTGILQTITAALSNPYTLEEVAEIVIRRGMDAVGASAGALSLLNDDGTFSLVRMVDYPPSVVERWQGQRYADTVGSPIPDAVRTRVPIWLGTTEEIAGRYPGLMAQLSPGHLGAWATVPLMVDTRVFGGYTFLFAAPRAFSHEDRAFMLALAQQCAQAVEQVRLRAAEAQALAAIEASRQRQAMLAEASVQLAASFEVQPTLEALARLAVPRLADWCVVDMYADDGSIQTMVIAHPDPAKEQVAWDMVRRFPINPDAPGGTAGVLRTRQPELVPELTEEILAAVIADRDHLRMLMELGVRSTLCVPLIARGRALGTIALVAAESGRRYGAEDVPFVEDLARRAALAVDNARLYQAAREAVQLRDTFFSVAAHELKTPLTALLGHGQLLLRRAGREGGLQVRDQRAVHIMVNQAARLHRMILLMLDSTRLEHGQFTLERAPVDLAALTAEIVAEVQATTELHALRLVSEEQSLVIKGDAFRLEQVLQNLIGNAVKYSPDGGAVTVRLACADDQVRIAVQDCGIGIPAAAIPQLFQRYYRASNAVSQSMNGMGIGLYVVREIIALHGGTIGVESVEGQGSTFTVELPLASDERR
jgi:excisionase family DNA binding protein